MLRDGSGFCPFDADSTTCSPSRERETLLADRRACRRRHKKMSFTLPVPLRFRAPVGVARVLLCCKLATGGALVYAPLQALCMAIGLAHSLFQIRPRYAESSLFRLYAGISELGNVVGGNSNGFHHTLPRFSHFVRKGKHWSLSARPGTRLPEVKNTRLLFSVQGTRLPEVSLYLRILAWCTALAVAAGCWCRFSFSLAVVDFVPKEHKDARTRGDRNRRENPKDVNKVSRIQVKFQGSNFWEAL